MSVGFKIKKLREEKKLSQPELANILDISQSDLSKIENGRTKKIDFQLMDKVCKEFAWNVADSYKRHMLDYSQLSALQIWYADIV